MSDFQPFLAFREKNSPDFLGAPIEKPAGTLARTRRVILLLHGYNNTTENAATAYSAFRSLLARNDIPMLGIHWPGSNWSGFAFYMQSIGRAKETAPRLVAALRAAALGQPYLQVSIVAHSMGCRLAMEVLALLAADPRSSIVVTRVVLMAAAVPLFAINPGGRLRDPLTHTQVRLLSHYSGNDPVLKYAFRIGQSLAPGPEGAFPIALGSRRWSDPLGQTDARVTQRDADPAKHGDYWGHRPKSAPLSRATAAATREFLYPGQVARPTPTRELAARAVAPDRGPSPVRTVPARARWDA